MKSLIQFISESLLNMDDREDLFNALTDILDSNYETDGKDWVETVVMGLADGDYIEDFLEQFMYDYPGLEWLEREYTRSNKSREDIDALIMRHTSEWLRDNGF